MILANREKSAVLLAFFSFIIFTYIPGMVLYPFFKERFHSYFSYNGSALEAFVFVFLFFLFVFFIVFFAFDKLPKLKVPTFSSRCSKVFFFVVAVVFVLAALYFSANYSISFRHKNRLSDAGPIVIIMFFIKYIVLVYTYLCFSVLARNKLLSISAKLTLSLMLIGWVLSINSSLQIIYVFIVSIMLFKPTVFGGVTSYGLGRIFLYFFIGVICFTLVLAIGIGNKVGMAFLFSDEGVEFFKGYISTVAARGSTSLYSLAMAYEMYSSSPDLSFKLTYMEFSTFINRLSLYFPIGYFDPDKIETVSRFNYLLSFANHADRAGGTPGFLATIILAGSMPLGYLVISVYLFILIRIMSRPMVGIESVGFLNVFVICYFLLPFMENPLSVVNALNPASFYFFSFIFIVHFFEPKKFIEKVEVKY